MSLSVVHALCAGIVAAASRHALSPSLMVATVGAVIALVATLVRLRAITQQVAALSEQSQATASALQKAQAREAQTKSDLEDKRAEVQTLKHEVGTQRKKNHSALEETKRLRQALHEETERRIAAQNTRPAFAEVVIKKEVPVPPPVSRAPQPVAPAPEPESPDTHSAMLALSIQVKTLKADIAQLSQTLEQERMVTRELKAEVKIARKKTEDLRRIDIISKSKMQVLEDKLRVLQRDNYEAISELAVFKGQVAPPPRRDPEARKPRRVAEAPETADAAKAAPQNVIPLTPHANSQDIARV